MTNCFYLNTADKGAGDGDSGGTTEKTAEEFASGEVAWLLQGEKVDQVWGQGLKDGSDKYPVLTNDSEKKVYKVTFCTQSKPEPEGYAVKYANSSGVKELPDKPTLDGMAFDHWSSSIEPSSDAKFDGETHVTGDMTVYAVGRPPFGGDSEEITLTTTYGEELTANLSQYVHYESEPEAPATGKFSYEITGNENNLNAIIDGDNLKIPSDANAGPYALTIQAKEKAPQYALMSVDGYGTADVTLTVRVSIAKATVTFSVTDNTHSYTGSAQKVTVTQTAPAGLELTESDYDVYYATQGASGTMGGTTAGETETGTYDVWVKLTNDTYTNYMFEDDKQEAKVGELTISTVMATCTLQTPNNLTYTGSSQPLVTTGSTSDGTMMYALGDNANNEPDNTAFKADIPTGTNAGTYYVWYYVDADTNHDDSDKAYVTVTIAKATPTVTAPTANTSLTYTAAAQQLIAAGSTVHGTMKYAVGDTAPSDDDQWVTDAAQITGTTVGTYKVWYKVVGDENHNNTEPVSLLVTIGKGEADVTGDSVTVTYGESVTLTVNVAVKATNGISLASVGQDQVVFTFPKGNQKTAQVQKTSGKNGTATVTIPAADVKNYFKPGPNTVTVSYGGSGNLNPKETVEITVTVNSKALDYTFTAEGKTYDGNTTVTGSLSRTTELVGSDNVTESLQEGAATAVGADAGTHNVTVDTSKVTLDGDGAEYYKVGTVTGGTVTISKAPILSVTAPTANDRTYDGTEKALVTAPTKPTEGTMLYAMGENGDSAPDDNSFTANIPQAKDAGTYYVWYYVKGDDNHNDSVKDKVPVTIEQKSVTLTWTGYDGIIYTGNPASVTANTIDFVEADTAEGGVVIKFSGNTETDAGEHSATATLEGSRANNYKLTNNTQTYTISKATASVAVSASDAPTYGESITLTATVSGVDASLITGTVTFKAGTETLGTGTVSNGVATLTLTEANKDKQKALFDNKNVIAEYGGDGNIDGGSGNTTVTVTPKALTYTVTADGKTYDGNTTVTVHLAPSNLVSGDSVTLSATGNLSSSDAATYSTVNLSDITKTGADEKYYSVEPTATNTNLTGNVNISPLVVTLDWKLDGCDTFAIPYDGSMHTVTAEVSNKVNSDVVEVTVQVEPNSGDGATDAIEAGSYTATATDLTGTAKGNYTLDGCANTTQAFTIRKVAASANTEPAANAGLTYTGAAQALVTAGASDTGEVVYALGNNTTEAPVTGYNETVSTGTNAGTYTVWYKVTGDANHTDAAAQPISVTIARAQAAVTAAPTPVTATYTGEDVKLVTGGTSNFGSLVYSLTEGGPFTVEIPTETEAGTYTVYYMVKESDNWNASDIGCVQAEIQAAPARYTAPQANTDLIYTGSAQELVKTGSTEDGSVMYALGTNATKAPEAGYNETVPTGTDAGTNYVWWKVQGDINHTGTEPTCITVTIDPATITFQAVEVNTPYTGAAISVTVAQTADEAPAIDSEKITVSYEQNGAAATPILPGAYDVTVSISDPNFTLAGGVESLKVGTLTITHVHVWSETEWVNDNNYHWHTCTGVGECTEGGVIQRVPHTFSEAVLSDGKYVYTCTVCNRTFTAPTESYSVTGKILDNSGGVVSGVTVTLKRGSETLAATVANDGGEYMFMYVLPGTYNIVAEKEDITMTALAVVTSDQTVDDITMPAGPINSLLEVKPAQEGQPETPAVVVGGLDQEAAKQSASGSTVTVSMTVEAKAEDSEDNSAEVQESIEAIKAESKGTDLEFIEISIQKTVSKEGVDDETTQLHETQSVITLVIPYDFTGKGAVAVYRYHDNAAETLSEGEGVDGTFRLDRENGLIYVYNSKFSTYAIGYTSQTSPTSYAVTAPKTEHGTVTADRWYAVTGRRVTLTARADEGYHLASLTVTYGNGRPVKLTDNGDGTWIFVQPAGRVTVTAEFVPCLSLGFTDLDTGAWYHDYTDYVIAHGLMQGIGGGQFAPDGTVSRAQMVTVLWNMSDKPVVNYYMTYSDVSEEAWYAEAVRWAAREGIAGGYGDRSFGPDDPITREQMAAMIYRYEQKYGDGGFTGDWVYRLPFTDLDKISDWAVEAVAWCNMEGVITGKDDNLFDPRGPAKRSEMAAILTRYCDEDDIK